MTTSNYARCQRCGAHDFMARHKCPPAWAVMVMDSEQDAAAGGDLVGLDKIYGEYIEFADSAEEAAQRRLQGDGEPYEHPDHNPMFTAVIPTADIEEDEEGRAVWPAGKYTIVKAWVEFSLDFRSEIVGGGS